MLCRRKKSNYLGFSSLCPSRDKCHCLLFYFWMSFSPLTSWVRFKWQLMSQFIHYRLLMIIAAGTKALFRWWWIFFSFRGWVGISLIQKTKAQSWNNPTPLFRRMAAGTLWKNRLTLPPFLLLPPHQLPPPLNLSSRLHSNHSVYLSHLVCFAVGVSLNADCLSWFLIQQTGSNRKGTHTEKQTERYCAVMTDRRKQPPSILM